MALHLLSFVLGASTVLPCSSLLRSSSSRGTSRAAPSGVTSIWYEYSPAKVFDYPLNFASGRLSHQNFGGLGPDSGEQSLVFSNVGKLHGAPFDMKMLAATNQSWNGTLSRTTLDQEAMIAEFNMASGTHTKVNVHFLDSATQEPVTIPRFFMTVLDVDAGSLEGHGAHTLTSGGIESYRISHVNTFWVSKGHDIDIQHVGHEEYNFTATEVGGFGDNPTQAMILTREQQNRAVMVELRGRSWFQFDFAASPGTSARNVMFSGPSQLASGTPSFCLQPSVLDLSNAKLDLNNLDGKIAGAPREMHLMNVIAKPGELIDLTVSLIEGNYQPHNGSMNALNGDFVNINLDGNGAKVGFSFNFTKDGQPHAVTNLLFTFADIDQERAVETFESVSIVSGSGSYVLAWNSTLVATNEHDGFVTFASSMPGPAANNPEGDHLVAGQKDKAVTLAFAEPTASFTAYLTGQSKWAAGRNIAFGGDASLVC